MFIEEYGDYTVFETKTKNGEEIEMAVIDEFDFEGRHYVAAARVEGDTINEDGLYVYLADTKGDDFKAEKIESEEEYQRICEAYLDYAQEKEKEDGNVED